MGTFHQGKGELHGITVVVETTGPELYVGRCDDVDARGVILNDGDVHNGGAGPERDRYLAKAVQFGIWKSFDRLIVPADKVVSVRRLADL